MSRASSPRSAASRAARRMRERCVAGVKRAEVGASVVMGEAYTDGHCGRCDHGRRWEPTPCHTVGRRHTCSERPMLHRHPRRLIHGSAMALVGVLAATGVLPARPAVAAEPAAAAGARHLAETLGGSPNDYALVYERTSSAPDAAGLWAGKYVDQRSGA